jgi:hypothetical protein
VVTIGVCLCSLVEASSSHDACSRRNNCGSRIKHHPEPTRAAVLDYDTAWFGKTIKVDWTDGQAGPDLWVYAKLYVLGKNEPLTLVYRIDFEEFEDPEEESEV